MVEVEEDASGPAYSSGFHTGNVSPRNRGKWFKQLIRGKLRTRVQFSGLMVSGPFLR